MHASITTATVIVSEVRLEAQHVAGVEVPYVLYKYRDPTSGRLLNSSTYALQGNFTPHGSAREIVSTFRAGMDTQLYIDTRHPSRSSLVKPSINGPAYVKVCFGLFIGVLLLLGIMRAALSAMVRYSSLERARRPSTNVDRYHVIGLMAGWVSAGLIPTVAYVCEAEQAARSLIAEVSLAAYGGSIVLLAGLCAIGVRLQATTRRGQRASSSDLTDL
ncbi:MAG: hypothetical protein D8M59_15400 [Planctomycetes bacterium]|nr:hypothetical protein [Planctomycetota bacterium]